MKRQLFFTYIFLLFFSGCDELSSSSPVNKNVQPNSSFLKSTIIDAFVYKYSELTNDEKKNITDYAKYFQENENWNNGTKFNPTKSYYIKSRINRDSLAVITLSYSCGDVLTTRICTQLELNKKILQYKSYNNKYMYYGKYHNKWFAMIDEKYIPKTAKFNGHDMRIISTKNNIHTVLIGPLPFKPTSFGLTFQHGYYINNIDQKIIYPINKASK